MNELPTKTETLYNALVPLKVVTFNEIVELAAKTIDVPTDRRYIYRRYVARLIETGKLEAIRKGLFIVLSPLERNDKIELDKLLIASKIRKEYYLGFHSALEYYGSAYSAFNEVYICTQPKNRFDTFRYRRFTFKQVAVKDTTSQVVEKRYGNSLLNVSSKERTFLECVGRPDYAGGWEECLKSLQNLSGVDAELLASLTFKRRNKSLASRVGYVLEFLRDSSPFYEHISNDLLEEIESRARPTPQYLVKGQKSSLNKKWNLCVPDDFEEKLRGI